MEVKSDAVDDLDLHPEGAEDLVGVLAEAGDPAISEAGLAHRGVDRWVVLDDVGRPQHECQEPEELRPADGDPLQTHPDHLGAVVDDDRLRVVERGVFAVAMCVEDLAHHALG